MRKRLDRKFRVDISNVSKEWEPWGTWDRNGLRHLGNFCQFKHPNRGQIYINERNSQVVKDVVSNRLLRCGKSGVSVRPIRRVRFACSKMPR